MPGGTWGREKPYEHVEKRGGVTVSDEPKNLISELKSSLTRAVNSHIRSTFSSVPCKVPPKVPKAVLTAAENLNSHAAELGNKSGSAVTGAVINGLKLKDVQRKGIEGKLTMKNVRDMTKSLEGLVHRFGGNLAHLTASFYNLRKLAHVSERVKCCPG
jgi:hypothetical protein